MIEIIRSVAEAVRDAPPERRREVREAIRRHKAKFARSWRNAPTALRKMVEALEEVSAETDAEKIGAWRGGPGTHPAVDEQDASS